jgi:hypothetical protein
VHELVKPELIAIELDLDFDVLDDLASIFPSPV